MNQKVESSIVGVDKEAYMVINAKMCKNCSVNTMICSQESGTSKAHSIYRSKKAQNIPGTS